MAIWNKSNSGIAALRRKPLPDMELYVQIHDFLSDEKEVSDQLVQMAAESRATNVDGFKRFLCDREHAAGFTAPVVEINSVLTGREFMSHIAAGRPVLDLGIDPLHGALTHRIQWTMITNALFAKQPKQVARLYSDLGLPGAWRKDPAAWYLLVDSPSLFVADIDKVHSARSPEFLMAYMKCHPNSSVRRMHEFSASLAKGIAPGVVEDGHH